MVSGSGSDSAGTTVLLTERNSLAARVTELETKTRNLEEELGNVTEEKNVLHRQLGQVKEENAELEEKVKVWNGLYFVKECALSSVQCKFAAYVWNLTMYSNGNSTSGRLSWKKVSHNYSRSLLHFSNYLMFFAYRDWKKNLWMPRKRKGMLSKNTKGSRKIKMICCYYSVTKKIRSKNTKQD